MSDYLLKSDLRYAVLETMRRYQVNEGIEEFNNILSDMAHKFFMKEIQPFIDIKMAIHNITIPKILVFKDRVETSYNFSPEQTKALNSIDEHIAAIESKYKKTFSELRK